MSNLEFLRKNEKDYTVLGVDKETGYSCVFSSINEQHYNAENKAVKVYSGTDDNEMDFFVGEKEFETRFEKFELQEL